MKSIAKRKEDLKEKWISGDIETRVEMIKSLVEIGLLKFNEQIMEEVEAIAGPRYIHGKENCRWGRQNGSIYLGDQKVPAEVPRVRNKKNNEEIPLETYQKMQIPYLGGEQAYKKLLNGLSMRNYEESARIAPEVFGMSASSMSRGFKKATKKKLKQLQERGLSGYEFVVVFMDGKAFQDWGVMIALGITNEGDKIVLGLEQMSSEHSTPIGNLLEKLKRRGLRNDKGLLFVIDGSKGEHKAIRDIFGSSVVIQRCIFHKISNILSYMSKKEHEYWKKKLMDAYSEETYEEAAKKLKEIIKELQSINPSAAESLKEGLEETLTLHKLEIPKELRKGLRTTNCLESVLSQVERYTSRVCNWKNGEQIQRWVGSSLLETEKRLNKVYGYRQILILQNKLADYLKINGRAKSAEAA
jgi:transposase-like protein